MSELVCWFFLKSKHQMSLISNLYFGWTQSYMLRRLFYRFSTVVASSIIPVCLWFWSRCVLSVSEVDVCPVCLWSRCVVVVVILLILLAPSGALYVPRPCCTNGPWRANAIFELLWKQKIVVLLKIYQIRSYTCILHAHTYDIQFRGNRQIFWLTVNLTKHKDINLREF